MPRALSQDLRQRIVQGVAEGGSTRALAQRFGVSPSTVSNIWRLWRASGSVAPKKMGGDQRSGKTEAHGDRIRALIEAQPDMTLDEIQAALRDDGIAVGRVSIWRFFVRHGISVKKNRARRRAGAPGRGRRPRRLEAASRPA